MSSGAFNAFVDAMLRNMAKAEARVWARGGALAGCSPEAIRDALESLRKWLSDEEIKELLEEAEAWRPRRDNG